MTTEAVAVALATAGVRALAVMVAIPAVTPVTGTLTAIEPVGNVMFAGTVAIPGLLEARFTVKPLAGAATDRIKVRF